MKELNDIALKELIQAETGSKFNRKGYAKCPFHNEKTPSLSVKFYSDDNKERFKCFGCGAAGDAIDFIAKLKGLDYVQAREYLGLSVEKSLLEEQLEKVKGYIEWEITKFRKGQELLGIFTFTDKEGNAAYFKAKFKDDKGKNLSYYHIENDKVINKRGVEELPYNLYRIVRAIEDDKTVIICEGEKDANTLNSILKGSEFEATSVKGVKDISMLEKAKIYVCGDTGEAGEKYKWEVYQKLFPFSQVFKFINLPGIKDLGDNKDVTDWLEAGRTKKDLLNAFNRSLDLKSTNELQQDSKGIYKTIVEKDGEEEVKRTKKYIADFRIIKATRIKFTDECQEGVKLKIKSITGEEIERTGFATVFDDIKTFKNFLGSLDLAFKGNTYDLTELKIWVNKYFAIESEELYAGVKFIEINDKIVLVTNEGAIAANSINNSIKSDGRNAAEVIDVDPINKAELKEVMKHILRFATPDKTISIIGTIINNLAVYHNQELKLKLHHLLIVGESGSGKSTILENVIAPILNYPKKDIKSIGLITPFALIKGLSDGNYPILFDEFKPSSLDDKKIAKLSETLRNLYDRATISRGDRSFKSRDFQLNRPIVLVGEESYPNQEKALIERSCIVYLAKAERKEEHTASMVWITENKDLINKLGRSLIQTVLELSVDDYRQLREKVTCKIELKNRPANTAINVCTGIEIFNILIKGLGLKEIKNYEEHVIKNIKAEVLEDGEESYSIVEQMLILYNSMIEDGRAKNPGEVIKSRADGIFIKTTEMLNQIYEHVSKVGAELMPLGLKDFRKQAKKAGYIIGISDKVIKVEGKTIRYDSYSDKLKKLKISMVAPPDIEEATDEDGKIIQVAFEGKSK